VGVVTGRILYIKLFPLDLCVAVITGWEIKVGAGNIGIRFRDIVRCSYQILSQGSWGFCPLK
jgi:hypothetical protein